MVGVAVVAEPAACEGEADEVPRAMAEKEAVQSDDELGGAALMGRVTVWEGEASVASVAVAWAAARGATEAA